MTTRLFFGAIGGLMPVALPFIVLDAPVIDGYIRAIADPNLRAQLYLAGYVVKALLLAGLGGLWAFMHQDEKHPLKLFELGIVAPAMIAGLLTAADLKLKRTEQDVAAKSSAGAWLVPGALAAPPLSSSPGGGASSVIRDSILDFLDGLFGRLPHEFQCSAVDASVFAPRGYDVTVSEEHERRGCRVSVSGRTEGERITCLDDAVTVFYPESFVVSVTETENGRCIVRLWEPLPFGGGTAGGAIGR